jgi:golgi SNAP receptor complex member 2
MHRTVDDYDSMAKREIIKAKQEKAQMYGRKSTQSREIKLIVVIHQASAEVSDGLLRTSGTVWKIKSRHGRRGTRFGLRTAARTHTDMIQKANAQRNELLGTSSSPLSPGASDTRRRFAQQQGRETPPHSESPFSAPSNSDLSREHYALHEHTFIQSTEARLDEFLAQGREVYDNLVDQRNMLKGTKRRLLDAANTLGLSRDVIGWIDRRRFVYLLRRVFAWD